MRYGETAPVRAWNALFRLAFSMNALVTACSVLPSLGGLTRTSVLRPMCHCSGLDQVSNSEPDIHGLQYRYDRLGDIASIRKLVSQPSRLLNSHRALGPVGS